MRLLVSEKSLDVKFPVPLLVLTTPPAARLAFSRKLFEVLFSADLGVVEIVTVRLVCAYDDNGTDGCLKVDENATAFSLVKEAFPLDRP